jgi:ubiquinone/menaquinone biosynthesis C-methylase UbiE
VDLIEKKNYSKKILFGNSFVNNLIKKSREKFFYIFKQHINFNSNSKILDVGSVDLIYKYENIFIHKYIYKKKISCLSNTSLKKLKKKYPMISMYTGDGRKMQFKSNFFDIVHSNATIEHVGHFQNQTNFVSECFRVSKKYVFIQTPYRFFLFDFHTKLPILHTLPKKLHRYLLKLIGLNFYSKESNLNLLSIKDLHAICSKLNIINYKILKHKTWLMTSNIILIIRKNNY